MLFSVLKSCHCLTTHHLNKIQSSLCIINLAIKQRLKSNKHLWNNSSSPQKRARMSFGVVSLYLKKNQNLLSGWGLKCHKYIFIAKLWTLTKILDLQAKTDASALSVHLFLVYPCVCPFWMYCLDFCLFSSFHMFNIHSYDERCRFAVCFSLVFSDFHLSPGSSTTVSVPSPLHLPEDQFHKPPSPRK